jgi:type VI secretion system protein ImpK
MQDLGRARAGLPSSARSGYPAAGRLAHADAQATGTLLLDLFDEFYREVILLKRLVTGSAALPPSMRGRVAPTADGVRQRLLDVIEAHSLTAGQLFAEHDLRVFEEAQYVMVAMADEVFLRLGWSGRDAWADKPLEGHVFKSHNAGERIFKRLDDLLESRAAASTELLTIYLTALALGFQGKYAGSSKGEPETYRTRLAGHIYRIDPDVVAPGHAVFPDAEAHLSQGSARRKLPSVARGLTALIIVVVGWLILEQIFWLSRTAEVNEALDRIEGAL